MGRAGRVWRTGAWVDRLNRCVVWACPLVVQIDPCQLVSPCKKDRSWVSAACKQERSLGGWCGYVSRDGSSLWPAWASNGLLRSIQTPRPINAVRPWRGQARWCHCGLGQSRSAKSKAKAAPCMSSHLLRASPIFPVAPVRNEFEGAVSRPSARESERATR